MQALITVVRVELIRALRSRTFWAGALVLGVLLVVAFVLEAVRHGHLQHEASVLQAQVHQSWLAQPDRHPHRVAHYGQYALRQPGPLGFLDPGLESFAGAAVFLEPHQRNFLLFSEATQSSELSRFGTISPAFVLQVLLPLLVFCITFGSVAAEREGGLWSLQLSQGVSSSVLLLGKIVGALLQVAAWVLPGSLIGIGLSVALGAVRWSPDTILRFVSLAAAYAVYVAGCVTLGVLVSAVHRRARGALLSLLALWVAVWIITPRLATEAARRIQPAPQRAELEVAIAHAARALGDSHDPDNLHFQELRARTLAQHGVSRIEDLPVNYGGVVMRDAEHVSAALYNDFFSRLFASHREQGELALQLGAFSPLMALRSLSMALAGTDGHHLVHFEEQAEAHRYRFIQELNHLHTTKIHWHDDRSQRVERSEWQRFESFVHRLPDVDWALARATTPLAALTGWALLLWAAFVWCSRRAGVAA